MFKTLTLAVCFSAAVYSQSFLAADVHESAKSTRLNSRGGSLRRERYDIRNATLLELIRRAYSVDADKIVGGPRWLEMKRFDVIAKAPKSAKLQPMLQALLAERFKLTVHEDTRPMPAYALIFAQEKHKLRTPEVPAKSNCDRKNSGGGDAVPVMIATCRSVTMDEFVTFLRSSASDYVDFPATNQTNVKGSWDFELKWTGRTKLAQAGGGGATLFDALEKQLGLKLELRSAPAPVLVVDRAEATPTPNALNVDEVLGRKDDAEFEVTDVKQSPAGADKDDSIDLSSDSGRVDARGISLKALIQRAWDISGDQVAEAPGWLGSKRFDLAAKVDITEVILDSDSLQVMLQSMLEDRFHLKTHWEDRPITAYKLTAAKNKMTKANAADRATCRDSAMPGTKDPREKSPSRSKLVMCANVTMAEFADRLQIYGSDYIKAPLFNATGLEGTWNLVLNFSTPSLVKNAGVARPPSNKPGALADLTDAISLEEALSSQLGLKLETEKRLAPVLLIDHVDENPTDN